MAQSARIPRGELSMLVIGAGGLAVKRVLCIGAHADDIEIGCAGTVIALRERNPELAVDWVVLSAAGEREEEARRSAERLLAGAPHAAVRICEFRERYFPYDASLKELFDTLPAAGMPDLVLSPWRGDAHQDHRTVAELVHNTFRDQLVLEYEIPKVDGDLGRPSVYVRLTAEQVGAKVTAIIDGFPSQASRPWFAAETFRGLMRLRGVECNAPSGYAEAFHAKKVVLA